MNFPKTLILFAVGIFLISSASAMVLGGLWQNNADSIIITSGNSVSFSIDFGSMHSPSNIGATLYNSNDIAVWQKNYNNLVNINLISDTIPQTNLTPGNYELILNGNDAANYPDSDTLYLTVNFLPNSAPVITSSPVTGVNEGSNYSYDFNATDADNDTLNYSFTQFPSWLSINSSTGLISGTAPSILVNTSYPITVQVSDGQASATQTYILNETDITSITPDTTFPVVNLNLPNNNSLSNISAITFNATASDNVALANVSLYINGTLNQTNSSGLNNSNYLFTLNLSNGTYSWNYQACDTSGNCIFSSNRTLTINTSASDTISPYIQFISSTPANNSSLSQNYIPVNITSSDASGIQNITVRLYNSAGLIDTQISASSQFFYNFTNLNSGTYYINATAMDNAGNVNSTETRKIILSTGGSSSSGSSGRTVHSYLDVYEDQYQEQLNQTNPSISLTEKETSSKNEGTILFLIITAILIIGLGITVFVLIRKR